MDAILFLHTFRLNRNLKGHFHGRFVEDLLEMFMVWTSDINVCTAHDMTVDQSNKAHEN